MVYTKETQGLLVAAVALSPFLNGLQVLLSLSASCFSHKFRISIEIEITDSMVGWDQPNNRLSRQCCDDVAYLCFLPIENHQTLSKDVLRYMRLSGGV